MCAGLGAFVNKVFCTLQVAIMVRCDIGNEIDRIVTTNLEPSRIKYIHLTILLKSRNFLLKRRHRPLQSLLYPRYIHSQILCTMRPTRNGG